MDLILSRDYQKIGIRNIRKEVFLQKGKFQKSTVGHLLQVNLKIHCQAFFQSIDLKHP